MNSSKLILNQINKQKYLFQSFNDIVSQNKVSFSSSKKFQENTTKQTYCNPCNPEPVPTTTTTTSCKPSPPCPQVQSTNMPEGLRKLRMKQERFQKDDGLPIHLKGGITDKILLYSTYGLCLVGLGMSFKLFYDLAKP